MYPKKHPGLSNDEEAVSEKSFNNKNIFNIYSRLHKKLIRFAFRYFKNPQEVEDVVQEAFVKVIEAQQGREIKHYNSYMYQTVKNLALKQINKKDYRLTDTLGDLLQESAIFDSSTLEDQFESHQRIGLICQAIRQLPTKCQRVYILRKVYGLSQKEIAERMDISLKTVEAHLTKAVIRCTDYMDKVESEGQVRLSDSNGREYYNSRNNL